MSDDGQKIVGCTLDNVEQISKDQANGIILVVTQPNCEPCPILLQEAKSVVGDKIPIIETNVIDNTCKDLAVKLKVMSTPTAIYMKDGKEVGRVVAGGKNWDDVRKELREFMKPVAGEVESIPKEEPIQSAPASVLGTQSSLLCKV